MSYNESTPRPRAIVRMIVLGIACVIGMFATPMMVEHLDATEVMVIQSLGGRLTWYTTPGWKLQWLGAPTHYPKRSQYWFSASPDQGKTYDQSIKVRFNDGGHANVSGSIAWEMPIGDPALNQIHMKYGNPRNVEQQLVRTVVEKAIYMTGPLMSSKESYAERRNDLIRFIEDQIQSGVYQTKTETLKEKDPMTGVERTVAYVRLVPDSKGLPSRQEQSPLTSFEVHTYNLSLNSVAYDAEVEKQISAQQQATMQVQTAIAKAKEAEQQALTAEKNGQAEAAKAKWDQEVIKAKEVTQAQQRLEVARLEKDAAEQEKLKQILLGQGEAERRKLVMAADNALDARLHAWVEVNKAYAVALEKIQQPIVPQVQFGVGSDGRTGAQNLIDMLLAKTAKDLAVQVAPGDRK